MKIDTRIELPLEIIELEILPRLPAKFLGRCMCVCKQWKSIISSREFIRMNLHHVSKSLSNHKFLETYLLEEEKTIPFRTYTFNTRDCEKLKYDSSIILSLPFDAYLDEVSILGSMDGLVCIYLWRTCKAVLWNPLTRAYKIFSNSSYLGNFNIEDDAFAFYYDSSNNDYKLLHVVYTGSALGAYIYSHRSDSWRKIQCLEENCPCLSSKTHWSPGTFLGGNLYFALTGNSIEGPCWIISFNVKSEKFREIQFPQVPGGVGFTGSIVVVNSFIHLCITYLSDSMDESGELWRMMDGVGWKKLMTFSSKGYGCLVGYENTYITRNGNSLVILESNNTFYKKDIEDLATNWWVNCNGNRKNPIRKTIYLETLVSPN